MRRFWALIAVAVIAAAVLVALVQPGSGRPLHPDSTDPDGSKALATVLAGYGVRMHTTSDPADAHGQIVVVDPQDYSATQLSALARRGSLVLFGAGSTTLRALGAGVHPLATIGGATAPGCTWAGAVASGSVDLPSGTAVFTASGVQSCYGGAVLRGDGWTLLGSSRLLRNDTVARTGVAALDVNAISADRTVHEITWLLPGTSADASAAPTAWALFPDGARRAFVWLIAFGALLVLWRGRRFGRVSTEPLPVLVRAAEVVEGHGRLYLRASARERAAASLRAGALRRLAARLGLPRRTDPRAVTVAVAARTGRPEQAVAAVLLGPPPSDDTALVELAGALDELQAAAGVPVAVPSPAKETHA